MKDDPKCCDANDQYAPNDARLGFKSLDRTIKEVETSISYLQQELANRQNELKELKLIRKQVTPEIEAAAHALRKVGLI